MTLHLVKLCVGCADVPELRRWQQSRVLRGEALIHRTRQRPRRAEEILDGGSLYWVFRGLIQARQRILALDPATDEDGRGFCAIYFDPALIETAAWPQRPFQGWRYLKPAAAPPDLGSSASRETGDTLPTALQAELARLGLD